MFTQLNYVRLLSGCGYGGGVVVSAAQITWANNVDN